MKRLRRSIALSVEAGAAMLNINKGNKQIARGITAVLRPIDMP